MKILFIAPYPSNVNSKDGMIQRVKHVDNLFSSYRRTYLDIQIRRNFKKKIKNVDGIVKALEVNSITHISLINKELKDCDRIYVHSIAGFFYIFWKLPFLDYSKVILDAHGIFPEELLFAGSKKFRIFSIIERYVFSKLKKIICVTNAMRNHFLRKYPSTDYDNYLVYNILPSFDASYKIDLINDKSEKINIIYSGNLQAWQNIDLMLEVMTKNDNSIIKYTILTGDPSAFKKELSKINLVHAEVCLLSVKPEELPFYYSQAHYGFILRDDINVNRVANPTKLIEYLSFGITPIVKTPAIGDFEDLGYEYISYNDVSKISSPKKSIINQDIYKKLVEKMETSDLKGFVLND